MKRRVSRRFLIFALLAPQSSALSLLSASKAVLQFPRNVWRSLTALGKGERPEEGDLTYLVEGWPAKNFWGDLKTTPSRDGEDNGGPLYLPAPGKELTNVPKYVTQMCATMSSLLYDTNKEEHAANGAGLFYQTIEDQAQPNFESRLKKRLDRLEHLDRLHEHRLEQANEASWRNWFLSRIPGLNWLHSYCPQIDWPSWIPGSSWLNGRPLAYDDVYWLSPSDRAWWRSDRGSGLDSEHRIFDNHGPLKQTMAPMATAVLGETMIIAWRGSATPMDWTFNLNGAPVRPSAAIAKKAPGLRIHSGYLSLVENEMATNGEKILKAIKESGVTQVVFTGHSLGGGVAQVAHLYALSNWKEAHPDVAFRTLTFSAPMTFFFSEDEFDELEDTDKDKLARLKKTLSDDTRNFVFCGDIVPRLVGNTDYITKILSELEEESKGHFMHSVGLAISRIFIGNVREQFKAKVQHSMSSTDGLLALLSNYSHWSQLIYYQEKKTLDLAKYEFGCTLMSAEQFGKHFPESMKTSWGAFIWGYVWGASEVLLKADLIKTGPSQAYHNPESRSKKKVFTTVTDYLKDVHNVLPYAMSPMYNQKKFARCAKCNSDQ